MSGNASAIVQRLGLVLLGGWVLFGAPGTAEEIPYPHGEFEEECSNCHTAETWTPARIGQDFDHRSYGFVLEGSHSRLMCRSCHISLEFDQVSQACASCHSDVHNGELGVECSQCHSTNSWIDRGDELRSHNTTRFPLTGAHRGADCLQCHPMQSGGSLRFVGVPTECGVCHMEAFQRTTDPDHVALGFDQDCSQCHQTVAWEGANPGTGFDHGATGFPLSGAHSTLDCADCHSGNQSGGNSTQCVSCHQQDFQNAAQPNHVAGNLPTDCQQCHGSTAWSPATFDHTLTAFPLTGMHSSLTCQQCHSSGTFIGLAAECSSCHLDDYQQAPDHVASNFPQTCDDCHTTTTWTGAEVDHSFFPLTAGHSGVQCAQCHTSGATGPIPSDCVSCHQSDYTGAPGHVASGFPQTCESCHTVTTWTNTTFDHSFYPLSGGHNGVQCAQCHTSGVFDTVPTDCVSCHQSDYTGAPGHVASGFPQTCESCHTVTTWTNTTFDHSFYPLSGGHNGVQCAQCHTSGVFDTVPTDCVSCHQSDYTGAPGHVASGFPQTCESCHTVTTWTNTTFDHSFYPLSGGHNGVQCAQCHTSGVFDTVPTDCVSCHQSDYTGAPGHVASGFPQTCESCHTVTTWTNTTFDHSFYPLSGGHNGVQCAQCHTSGVFDTVPTDCVSCHQSDYTGAPGHVASGFPQTCESCHTVTTWTNTTFDHSFYPLSGGHNGVQCAQCHTSGVFDTVPTECLFCHQPDYVAAPGHVASGFPQTCESCHTITTWTNTTFDHSIFPLTGGHNGLDCVVCHTTGVYGTIPADCYACHQSDYQQAPDHQALAFPTDCESCHTTTVWGNVNFSHSFPIQGPHDRQCTDCHNTGTTQDFSCLGACHQHTPDRVDPDHSAVAGYVYDFQACLSCHPNGRD